MDTGIISTIPVDEQSIEDFATQNAAEIVEIDMTTPEYTADTCTVSFENSQAMASASMTTTSKKVGS
ncbi:MAG: hypothetical protein R3Y11_03600 [Pseudomonadota bacterium]